MKRQSLEERLGIKRISKEESFIENKLDKKYYLSLQENKVLKDLYDQSTGLLNEGYYKTYDKDTTLRYVGQVLDLSSKEMKCVKYNGENVFIVKLPTIPMQTKQGVEYLKEMNQVFGLCGYYLGSITNKGKNTYYQYEPRQEKEIKEKDNFYWHCTRVTHKDKIDKVGLTPRSNNAIFNYPNRIYLFKGSEQLRSVLSHAVLLESVLSKNTNNAVIVYSFYKVYPKIKLYTDPNFIPDVAVYTTENIPPSQMEFVGNYNILTMERVGDDFRHDYRLKKM